MKEHIYIKSEIDGLRLGVLMFTPRYEHPKGIIQFAHGMCGCKERLVPVMKELSEEGYICIANDHRGHGESIISKNDLGYMYDGGWNAIVEDLKTVSDYVTRRYPKENLFLVGHSMGSLAARIYASRYGDSLSGMFLCGSPAESGFAQIGWAISKMLCSIGQGHCRPSVLQEIGSATFNRQFSNEGRQAWTCSDADIRKAFAKNPLCNFIFTANGSMNLLEMLKEAYDTKKTHAVKPSLPVVLMNGEDDPCSKGRAGMQVAIKQTSDAGYRNIKSFCYPGMRHEILNENEHSKVLYDITTTIEGICSPQYRYTLA